MKEREEFADVDFLQLLKALWKKAWILILAMIACGGVVFAATKFLITPQYSSRILMYVNNKTNHEMQQSISQADLVAAQRLVDTYRVILRTQSTLEEVIAEAGLPYSAAELNRMIATNSVNGTEVFYVQVTGPNPREAAHIANTIGIVLPKRISSIVDGSSVRLVDYAQPSARPSSPDVLKNTVLGAIAGLVIACTVIIIRQLTNDKVSGPDYLTQHYEIPVLAVIPNLAASQSRESYYQSAYNRPGKGQ